VKEIDMFAFCDCSNITSISIPSGVTKIGTGAFQFCSSLTSVTIPNSVKEIGSGAFDYTPWYDNQPDGLIYTGKVLYKYKGTMPDGTKISLEDGTLGIAGNAFDGCSGLAAITIPNSVSSIGYAAFYECSSLTSVIIPDDVIYIDERTFEGCSGLTSATIGKSVKYICESAFAGCSKLKTITIPNSVTTLDYFAFNGCSSLTSVNIGNSLMSIRMGVFMGCSALTSVTIPNTVTEIGANAFAGCSALGSVTIPNSVTSIAGSSFFGCSSLTSVTIPNSVVSIGEQAFSSCISLPSITIPQGVMSIDKRAFSDCSSLASITIPTSVTSIGEEAFDGTAWYNNHSDGVIYLGKVLYKYKGTMPEGTKISIKKGTLVISEEAFYGCSGLSSITIPSNLTSIGGSAFYGCSSLTSVTIPNSVTSIGDCAFQNCSSLTSVNIPNNVTTIKRRVLYGCSSLTSVTIGNSVTSIDYAAFHGCSSLTSVIIPNSVINIGQLAFEDCTSLSSVTIPNSVTSIDYRAFNSCTNLTSVIIPNSVTFIGANAFQYCSHLTSVSISESVNEIGSGAFSRCPELTNFYCLSKNVPNTSDNAFYDSNTENATLYVPAGCLDAYKYTYPWIEFKNIVEITVKVKLDKTKATLEKTKTLTLKPTFTPSSMLDKSVTWKSSKPSVATVTSDGEVYGVKAGTATITCTSNATGAKATCKVTVGYVKLDQTEFVVEKTKTATLTATVYPSTLEDKSVTWKSSDTKVATVSGSGQVYGVKAGMATITCTSNATGLSTTCNVTVGYVKLDQTEAILEKTKTMTLKATVYPSKLEDKSVTWKSSNTAVATVSSKGKVKGVKAGTATITCTSNATGLSTTCNVTVGYVKLDQTEVSVKKGKTVTLEATVYPSKLEDKSVTWKSSDKSVATVTSAGKVKGIKAGTATITCTSNATGLSRTCKVTVTTSSGSRSLDGDEDDDVTGIEDKNELPAVEEPFDVYDLRGRKVLQRVTSLDGLPAGIYIVNGRKILKK
jgi:uncharacterized protein YjdB